MTKTKKPIIGCTEPSAFTENITHTIETFFNANPLKLCQNAEEDLHYWLEQCDAVILSGGVDIHPRIYNNAVLNNYNYSRFDVRRDVREIRIIKQCLKKRIPMLGICRGHQMLGLYHGLDFIPDLEDGLICHQPNYQKISHSENEPMHWVELTDNAEKDFEVDDNVLNEITENQEENRRFLWVNSFHHQGLLYKKTTKSVKVLGTAPGLDKQQIVEIMHGIKDPWLSVQWHPEYDWNSNQASRMILNRFAKMFQG